MAADRLRGQAERLEDRLGQLLAVQCAGHGAADPLVGQRALGAVQGELGVGGFEGLAHLERAQRRLPLRRLRRAAAGAGGVLLLAVRGLLAAALGVVPVVPWSSPPPAFPPESPFPPLPAFPPPGVACAEPVAEALPWGPDRPWAAVMRSASAGSTSAMSSLPAASAAARSSRATATSVDLGQLGGAAPPARVAGEADLAALDVDLLHREGPGGDLELAAGAVVEGVRGAHDALRVQRREQRLPVGVGPREGDPDLQVVLAPLDLLDAVVARVAGRPVRGVLAGQGTPLGGEVGGADLAPVAPDGLLVELVEHDLLGLGVDDLGRLQVVGVELRAAVRVDPVHRRQDGARDPAVAASASAWKVFSVCGTASTAQRRVPPSADPGPGRGGDVLRGRRPVRLLVRAARGEGGYRERARGEECGRAHHRAQSDAVVGHHCNLRGTLRCLGHVALLIAIGLIYWLIRSMRPLKAAAGGTGRATRRQRHRNPTRAAQRRRRDPGELPSRGAPVRHPGEPGARSTGGACGVSTRAGGSVAARAARYAPSERSIRAHAFTRVCVTRNTRRRMNVAAWGREAHGSEGKSCPCTTT